MSRKKKVEELEARIRELEARGLLLTREEVAGLVTQLESKHAWDKVVGRRAQPAWDKMKSYLKEVDDAE